MTKYDKILVLVLLYVSVLSLTQLYQEATTQHTTWYLKQNRLVGER